MYLLNVFHPLFFKPNHMTAIEINKMVTYIFNGNITNFTVF